MATTTLKHLLDRHVKEGELFRRWDDGTIECVACGHRCKLHEGRDGICKIRFRRDDRLWVPHGYVAGVQLDPIEKKPFFHAYPGSKALSFGMLGCDLHCSYCQNWITSQALTDVNAGSHPVTMTASQVVDLARHYRARVLTSTYNEPLITAEWAIEIFREAQRHGIMGSFVSNGNATPEVLEYIRPFVELYKVDLKTFNDKNYRKLGTTLKNVVESVRRIYAMGFWLEVVTLVIPGYNDSNDELRQIADFLVSVSADIPWHVTAFHPDYKMTDRGETPADTLMRAAAIGHDVGLHFVYAGNLPGETGEFENTRCPSCQATLVERRGYRILANRIVDARCPECRHEIPGRW